ncbi:hypothetical protein HDU76_000175 [Blyttiomyces sp. JEL0837]|nr:hypothetical protein HDU76_000175 [Blyttiomyces sp. JEL0837]
MGKAKICSKTFDDLHFENPTVISIKPDCTIEDALTTMSKNNVLTLPITSRAFPNKFVYILSSFDILLYIVSKQRDALRSSNSHGGLDLSHTVEMAMTMDAEMESYRVFERDFRDTLESTLVAFAKGAHRVLISDALGVRPALVLTQADILRQVARDLTLLQGSPVDFSTTTLAKAGLVRPVMTIQQSTSALEGYTKMAQSKVLAVPVLDNAQNVIATLSASDLRGLSRETVGKVSLPVMEFLEVMHSSKSNLKTKEDTICLTPSDTLLDALKMMVERDVHRIWIINDSLKPVGVISQSDLIGAIVGIHGKSA